MVAEPGLEFIVQPLQLGELRIAGVRRHGGGGIAFEQRHQVEDLGQVAFRHLGDIGAAAQLHRHQSFGGEHLQRFAQRRAADAVGGGQRLFVDPAAGRELVAQDLRSQPFGDLFVQRARRRRTGRWKRSA